SCRKSPLSFRLLVQTFSCEFLKLGVKKAASAAYISLNVFLLIPLGFNSQNFIASFPFPERFRYEMKLILSFLVPLIGYEYSDMRPHLMMCVASFRDER